MKPQNIPFTSLKLTSENIFREIGYGNQVPDAFLINQTEELLTCLKDRITPAFLFQIYPGEVLNDTLVLDRHILMETGKVISGLMEGAQAFAVFAATAGKDFQAFSKEIQKEGDLVRTFLLDVIGNCIVEKAGDYLEVQLKKDLNELQHTNRFSPGYCGWALTEQKKIFRLLEDTPCGIELSEVCLMNPIKSISGIIGVGKQVKKKQYACHICELKTCYKRKLKRQSQ